MKVHITKTLFYILFIFLLGGLFYIIFLSMGIFFDEWGIKSQVVYFLICSTLLTLFLKPIMTSFEIFTNKIFFPEQEKFKNEIDEICNKMINFVKYNEIFNVFLEGLSKSINNKNIIIFYYQHNDIYTDIYTLEKNEKLNNEILNDKNDSLLKIIKSENSIKIFDIYNDIREKSTLREKLLSLKFKKIIMLGNRNEMLGWIALGELKREKVNPQNINEMLFKLADKLMQAIEHARLYQEAKRESVEKGILIKVVKKISKSRDLQEILNLIIDSLAEIVTYDAAGIFLIDPEQPRNMTYSVLRGYNKKSFEGISLKVGKGIVGWSAQYGKGEIVPDVSKDKRYIKVIKETKSQMVIPIKSGEDVIGVLCLESNKPNFFNGNHYEVVKTFASQAAIGIENARLYFEIQKKEELSQEIKRASDIQRALFPKKVPNILGYEISTFNQYSMELGGDLHDLKKLDEKKLGVAIGDASGKGVPGAILMSTLYATFRMGRESYLEINEVIERLNDSITSLTRPDTYATFFYGILDIQTGIFRYTNAGHNPPYLIKSADEFKKLEIGGTVLGFFKGIKYKKHEVKLEIDDVLVLYTDGITECKNKWDEEFGEKRFLNILLKNRSLAPKKLQEKIVNALHVFAEKSVFSDDISLVIIKKVSEGNIYEELS